MEEWLPIIGFEGIYEVSNFGRVRRIDSNTIRVATILDNGYLHLQLYKGNKFYGRYVHRLVLEAFVGICPDRLEGRHLNDDKNNCRLDNLCWGTSSQNNKIAFPTHVMFR